MKNLIKKAIVSLPLLLLVILPSCYTDYGLDTSNYDVVVTLYDNQYNFQTVVKYYYADTLVIGNDIDASYKTAINNNLRANLNNLGWQSAATIAEADIVISAGVTSTTTLVSSGGGCYWDYWGYYWCYPTYGYDYSYTTGSLFILMNDRRTAVNNANNNPEWVGAINGLADQGNVVQRIGTTINKAFSQSPYLKKN